MLYKVIIWLKSLPVDGRSNPEMINLSLHSCVFFSPHVTRMISNLMTHIEANTCFSWCVTGRCAAESAQPALRGLNNPGFLTEMTACTVSWSVRRIVFISGRIAAHLEPWRFLNFCAAVLVVCTFSWGTVVSRVTLRLPLSIFSLIFLPSLTYKGIIFPKALMSLFFCLLQK